MLPPRLWTKGIALLLLPQTSPSMDTLPDASGLPGSTFNWATTFQHGNDAQSSWANLIATLQWGYDLSVMEFLAASLKKVDSRPPFLSSAAPYRIIKDTVSPSFPTIILILSSLVLNSMDWYLYDVSDNGTRCYFQRPFLKIVIYEPWR